MEKNFQTLQNFIKENSIDLESFYSVHLICDNITLQGQLSKSLIMLGSKFGKPEVSLSGSLEFKFQIDSAKFSIVLT